MNEMNFFPQFSALQHGRGALREDRFLGVGGGRERETREWGGGILYNNLFIQMPSLAASLNSRETLSPLAPWLHWPG